MGFSAEQFDRYYHKPRKIDHSKLPVVIVEDQPCEHRMINCDGVCGYCETQVVPKCKKCARISAEVAA